MTIATDQKVKLRFDEVGKKYLVNGSEFTALTPTSLDIFEGEFVTVVGPSGCGKSTLMSIAAGLITPTAGTIAVDGAVVTAPDPKRGVIFQQYALFPWLTVRKNVEFGLRLKKVGATERREKAQHFIDLVGLTDFADALPKMLSGGMKQRAALARAYAADPEVLLMDEPFGAIDALTRVKLQEQLLQTWSAERRTVMFITHDVDEAVYLANRVVIMAAKPGRIKKIVDIDLPYPRTAETRLTPAFTKLRETIWRGVYNTDEE